MQFHERTLQLLASEPLLGVTAAPAQPGLPASVAEWTALNGWAILTKYSNMDWFGVGEAQATDDGARGIPFHRENQGNFDRLFLLEHGEDPPVRFGWVGAPPWIVGASTFSDAVFAQVFDWQCKLEFIHGEPQMTYYAVVAYRDDAQLNSLGERFQEVATTWFCTESGRFVERRFVVTSTLRLHSCRGDDEQGIIEVMGTDASEIRTLHDELVGLGFESRWRGRNNASS